MALEGIDLGVEIKLQTLTQSAEYATTFQAVAEELLEVKKNDIHPSYFKKV